MRERFRSARTAGAGGRCLALLAVSALAVACGTSSGTGASGSGASGSAPTSSTDTRSSAVTNYAAYAKGKAGRADSSLSPVTIGWVNQQGGTLAYPDATAAAQAAVRYINSRLGGIAGHPLRLDTCFIATNESEGTSCGQQLVNNPSVHVVLYGTLITGDNSFQAVDNGTKPILMANAISPSDGTAKNAYIYNGTPASIFGGIATYLTGTVHAKHVSIIYPQNAQTAAGVQSLETALKSVGVTPKVVGFDETATDVTAPAVAAGVQTADAVVAVIATPTACVAAAKALESLNVTVPIVGFANCFTTQVAKGLGGSLPHWVVDSTDANFNDTSEPGVRTYLSASASAGLPSSTARDTDAELDWALVMTAARFLNEAGGADATSAAIARAAKSFRGPMMLGGASIRCGAYPSAPALCGAQSREYKYLGNGKYQALTGWINPAGM
jgi:branched-chain amino acid transport system substrate-binding protein